VSTILARNAQLDPLVVLALVQLLQVLVVYPMEAEHAILMETAVLVLYAILLQAHVSTRGVSN
jgi:hypothetical protein